MTGHVVCAERDVRRVYALTSLLLRYPDDSLRDRMGDVRAGVDGLAQPFRGQLQPVVDWLTAVDQLTAQEHYVAVFDRTRKACLYLSYYLNGDTRRRGMALVGFKELYRADGWDVSDEELPDFLPVVLEFGAVGDLDLMVQLLDAHRAGLELLAKVLRQLQSVYARAAEAVLATLPHDAGAVESALVLAAQGPPVELVGLEPFPFDGAATSGARS